MFLAGARAVATNMPLLVAAESRPMLAIGPQGESAWGTAAVGALIRAAGAAVVDTIPAIILAAEVAAGTIPAILLAAEMAVVAIVPAMILGAGMAVVGNIRAIIRVESVAGTAAVGAILAITPALEPAHVVGDHPLDGICKLCPIKNARSF
jgi:hypothetical protein